MAAQTPGLGLGDLNLGIETEQPQDGKGTPYVRDFPLYVTTKKAHARHEKDIPSPVQPECGKDAAVRMLKVRKQTDMTLPQPNNKSSLGWLLTQIHTSRKAPLPKPTNDLVTDYDHQRRTRIQEYS